MKPSRHDRGSGEPDSRGRKLWFLAGTVLVGIYLVYLLHPIGSGLHHTVSNGDAYHHMWNLWWVHTALVVEHQSPYYTDYNGFPETIPLVFHQLILPLGVLSIPLFLIGLYAGQVLLFWQYAAGLLGFWGMYLLLSRWKVSPVGCAAVGLYYVLTPLFWQNLPRPDSLTYVLFPWIILSLYWAGTGRRWRLLVPVVLAGFVFLMSPYFGAGIILIWGCALPWADQLGLPRRRLVWLVPGMLAITSFHWVRQVLAPRPNLVSREVIERFSADLTAWVLPHYSVWWLDRSMAPWFQYWSATEPSLYIGWVPLVVLILGWHRIPRTPRVWGGATAALFFVIALGPGIRLFGVTWASGWLPYGWGLWLMDSLRGFRAPLRFGYFVILLFALGVGCAWPRRREWSTLCLGLILLELMRSPIPAIALPEPEALRAVSRRIERPALVPIPLTDWPTEVQYGQTVHHRKVAVQGLSYGVETVWERVGNNPVLEALYAYEPLPDTGWNRLIEEGYGGVIVHHRFMPGQYASITRRWRRQLRQRWGKPVLKTPAIELYRFPNPESRSETSPPSGN